MMRQIICMKWGTLYSSDYVNRLYNMVRRNLTGDFRFVCLTDDPQGIRPEVECYDCPSVNIPSPQCNKGWRKVSLWDETVPGLNPGTALFIDLDVVITGPIDEFFEIDGDFIVCRNWSAPGLDGRIGNTSVYRFRIGSHPYLLSKLLNETDSVLSTYSNSQTYISRTINAESLSFWPDGWCHSFKVHCVPKGLLRYRVDPILPEGSRIVVFPGVPNPPDAAVGQWPAPWYKKFYKHIRPAKWVAENWR